MNPTFRAATISTMSEVSGRAWSFFVNADRRGIVPLNELLDGSPFARVAVSRPHARVRWDDWAQLTDRFAERLTRDQLIESGCLALNPEFMGGVFGIAGIFTDIRDVYRLGITWIGPQMYRSLSFTYDASRVDELEIGIRVRPGFRPCEAWFVIFIGVLRSLPQLYGLPTAEVDATTTPEGATYRVTVPGKLFRLGRVRRAIKTLSVPRVFARALDDQQRQITVQLDALRENESGYAALLDALPAAVLLVENGRVVYANPSSARVLGYEPLTLTGVAVDVIVHPDDRDWFENELLAGAAGQHSFRMCRRDGTVVHLEGTALTDVRFHGRQLRGVSVIDVSGRVDAEARLVLSEDTLTAVIAVMPDLLLHLNRDGTIVNVLGGLALGADDRRRLLSCADLRTIFGPNELNQPELLSQAFEMIENAFRTGETKLFEFRILHDTWFTIEGRLIPLLDRDELVLFIRDVTKRYEQTRQLALTERMASVGTLAAGVAHEINSPLSFVAANLDLLLELLDRNPNIVEPDRVTVAREMLSESIEGARRVDQIVRALGQFARPQQTTVGPVDVESAVHSAIALVGRQVRQRATLSLELAHTEQAIANADRLNQVLVNLLVNAVHATPEGDPAAHTIAVRTAEERDRIVIEVRDSGSGIAPDVLPRIFDPFFTTKAVGEGSGLGLSISHRLIRELDGTLEATSELGRGTTMRIELQRASAAVAHDATEVPTREPVVTKQAAEAPVTPRVRATVLVIDDEPLVGRVMQRALAAHDTTVEISGAAALERLRNGFLPDLILCDLMLPGITGMEIYDEASAIDPALAARFLFMTGGAFTPRGDAFALAHADDLIRKPVDVDELREVVRQRLLEPVC